MDRATTIALLGLIAAGITLTLWGMRRPATGPNRRPALAVGLVILALCAVVVVAVAIGVSLAPP
jgi:quinol-cytochrome oxidoreductase complex cytochrome b subunit